MSQAGGRSYCAIPGPSVVPDEVLQAMHRASPNIYAKEVVELTESLIPDLCRVARTHGQAAIYIGNGHAAWEASLVNTLASGDRVLLPIAGLFGRSWANMAVGLGLEVDTVEIGHGAVQDLELIRAALDEDKTHKIKAVLLTHVDTSTSYLTHVKEVRDLMRGLNHPALLFSDNIASLGCDRFEMDEWGVDVMVASSQKGLMTPPGLSFVFFGEKAARAREGLVRVSPYWDWKPRTAPELFYQYFAGTAPTHHLFGLRVALDMIHDEGIEVVWNRHERLSRAIWAAVEAWGQAGSMRLGVNDVAHRSRAVTSLLMDPPQATRLRGWVETQTGVTLGIGLGMETQSDPKGDGAFRIGHMGHVNAHMVLGVLGAIEAGMAALDIAHGPSGVSAAAQVISREGR